MLRAPSAAAVAALAALALLLASCGTEEEPPPPELSAQAMLDRAFERLPASGRAEIDVDAQLPQDPSERATAQLEGPFDNSGGPVPSFDLDGQAQAAGFGVDLRLVSTGDDAFVVFFGENYRVGRDRVAAIGQRSAGIDPRTWFGSPRHAGVDEVADVDSYRIEAPLDADALAADLSGLGGAPADLAAFEGGSIDAWVGVEDGTFHRLQLISDALEFDLELTALGEPQEIEPPPGGGFQPIEDLLGRIPGL